MEKAALYKVIAELFAVRKGAYIMRGEERIMLGKDVFITRRALKHIVERRKDEGLSFCDICLLIHLIVPSIQSPNSARWDENSKRMRAVKPFHRRQAVVVIYELQEKTKEVVTAFFRNMKIKSR